MSLNLFNLRPTTSIEKQASRPSLCALEARLVPASVTTASDIVDSDPRKGDFIGPDGVQSLPEAILEVNTRGGTIGFKYPMTINLTSPLPALTRRTTISGETTDGGQPAVVIDGNGISGGLLLAGGGIVRNLVIKRFGGPGLQIRGYGIVENNYIGTDELGMTAAGNGGTGLTLRNGIVRNNVISGNSGDGVVIEGKAVLEDNKIGTNKTGELAVPNGQAGVQIWGAGSLIKGNTISGNLEAGVRIAGNIARLNRLNDNKIGVAENGIDPLPNQTGVVVTDGANNNIIGGSAANARNVISGNLSSGVELGYQSAQNTVSGNFIGLDINGALATPNQGDGIFVLGGRQNRIGGIVLGAGNYIAGNLGTGIRIESRTGVATATARANVVIGNIVGLNATKDEVPVPNALGGVRLAAGAISTIIGGSAASSRNLISGNSEFNVGIFGAGTNLNRLLGNYIGTKSNGEAALPLPLQPSSTSAPGVVVDDGASQNEIGGLIRSARNLIAGNIGFGVLVAGISSTGNIIRGNLIGTNGTVACPNGSDGVAVQGAVKTVIGGAGGGRNVISGNRGNGVSITGDSTQGKSATRVVSNFIGTDITGKYDLGNMGDGISINASKANLIGGATVRLRNVISGNVGAGIHLTDRAAENLIRGNYIGTDFGGNSAVENEVGILAEDVGPRNEIGAGVVGAGNLISGNRTAGIHLAGLEAEGITIRGNRIGTNSTGLLPLGNKTDGLLIEENSGNKIGGLRVKDGNVIAFNVGNGICIKGIESVDNTLSRNRIFDNGEVNIEHLEGANHGFSDVSMGLVFVSPGKIVLTGKADGAAGKTIAVELFANPEPDPASVREGTFYLGRVEGIVVDENGGFTLAIRASVPKKYKFLTITVQYGLDTSEFSESVRI